MSKGYLILVSVLLAAVSLAQPPERIPAGTTWYPLQQNGTVGRMVYVDSVGFTQVVWMNSLNSSHNQRHVYWNVSEPMSDHFETQHGHQAVPANRSGYVTVAGDWRGFAYPAFHQVTEPTGEAFTAVGFDFLPGAGAFTASEIPRRSEQGNELSIMWPKIASTGNDYLHVVAAEFNSQRIFYSRGVPVFDNDETCTGIDWTEFAGEGAFLPLDTASRQSWDIASAWNFWQSERVAIAYTKPTHFPGVADYELSNDVHLLISDDNGLTWHQPRNITQFAPPDVECYNESNNGLCCTRDTLRAFGDLCVLFDLDGWIHIAFTTIHYNQWNAEGFPQANSSCAQIWHWSEQTDQFSLIAQECVPESPYSLGMSRAMVHKPSLAQQWNYGPLFCSYLRYDTAQVSDAGMLNADVWIARSGDLGASWSASVNVTNTVAPPFAPHGENQSEQDPSLALTTTFPHRLALTYFVYTGDVYDPVGETGSLSTVYLQRVDTDIVPPNPLLPSPAFHAEIADCSPQDVWEFVPAPWQELAGGSHADAWDIVRCADLDGDTDLDVVAAATAGNLIAWWEYTDEGFEQRLISSQVETPNSLELADLDRNGTIDIAVTSYEAGELVLFCNSGGGDFTQCTAVDQLVHPLRVTIVDWQANNRRDLVVSLGDHAHVLLLEQQPGGDYNVADLLNRATWPPEVVGGLYTFDRRGFGEWLHYSPSAGFLSYQNSAILPIQPYRPPFAEHLGWLTQATAADLDDDSLPDVVAASSSRGRISWWRNLGVDSVTGVRFEFQQITRNLPAVTDIAVADLTHDDVPDIVACASDGYDAVWFANDGRGRFTRHELDLGDDGWKSIRAADLDGDLDTDIIAAGTAGVRWIENAVRSPDSPGRPLPTDAARPVPTATRLNAAYPNPFNATTTIEYSVVTPEPVRLAVYDIAGREVATLVNEVSAVGVHRISWDARHLASGLYIVSLRAGSQFGIQKLMLLK